MEFPQIFHTHVMKTGGTSLQEMLRAHVSPEFTYPSSESSRARVAAKVFSSMLLELEPEVRRDLQLISVHHPAWVAFTACPDAFRITMLREPVARTVSHLRQLAATPHVSGDIVEIYDQPGWRDRLANFQTQLFADDPDRARAPTDDAPFDFAAASEEEKAAFREGLSQVWGTSISDPFEPSDADLASAKATLERYDVVGVTEDLPRMVAQLNRRTGLSLGAVGAVNVSASRDPVPDHLLARIAADTELDTALYEHARALAQG